MSESMYDRLHRTAGTPAALVVSGLDGHPYRVSQSGIWIFAHHDGWTPVAQGWKLHISARPSTLTRTLQVALPVLARHRCNFKVVRNSSVLWELNSTRAEPSAVGKAITVYPPQEVLRVVASALGDALAGLRGPRVRSDRRLRHDSPVYYRYGPIAARLRQNINGEVEPLLTAPDGSVVSGVATPFYRAPSWVADPFIATTPVRDEPLRKGPPLLGGRYQVTKGISHTARGIVCRARDTATGGAVVIKQAYAHVSESDACGSEGDGTVSDLTHRLRNERRLLYALRGIPRVPQVLDHFAHSDSEFLVTSDLGPRNLRQDTADHGTYLPWGTGRRSLVRLAADLLSVLDSVHRRGVVVRDLTPKNIVLTSTGRIGLIDFELSRYQGVQYDGWTPGYAAPGQSRGVAAASADDYFSLGATLVYAATGMDPVCIPPQSPDDVPKTLRLLADVYHPRHTALFDVIAGLLSSQRCTRRRAAAALRGGRPYRRPAAGRRLVRHPPRDFAARPAPPPPSDQAAVDRVVRHSSGELIGQVGALVSEEDPRGRLTNAYLGSAGLGLELLHHLDVPGAGEALSELAGWTVRCEPTMERPRGLYFGSMGTAVFLMAAARKLGSLPLFDAGLEVADRALTSAKERESDDHIHGLAGIGTGWLLLHRLTGEKSFLTAAEHCADSLMAGRFWNTDGDSQASPALRRAGINVGVGFGHGLAGTAEFLVSCSAATGDARMATEARQRYKLVLSELPGLIAGVRSSRARSMSLSWCQGFAGIGSSLVRAAEAGPHREHREEYLDAARGLGLLCLARAPHVPLVTQCCGLAGVGELMLDLAGTDEPELALFRRHAFTVVGLILTRSGGTAGSPVFPDTTLTASSNGWANGATGVLSYFRRLRDGRGGRLWSSAWHLLDDSMVVGVTPRCRLRGSP